jgi:hypothetical protein
VSIFDLILSKHYLLSKTSYIRGLQCYKALFLYRYYPQLKDAVSPSRQAAFNRGHDVGVLARQLFPGGVDATSGVGARSVEAVERTRQLMQQGVDVIYEAAFVHDEVLVLADILVRDGANWKVYEIKSSLRLSRAYYQDAALQYFVINGTGLGIKDFYLVHLNPDYVRNSESDLDHLFRKVSVLAYAQEQLSAISAQIIAQKQLLNSTQIPDIATGARCFSPYTCDFMSYCWKNYPKNSVFQLAGISRTIQENLYNMGQKHIEQVIHTDELPRMTQLQIIASREKKPIINKSALQVFINQFKGQIDFLDIENVQSAVPRYAGVRPFMALPFAYSLHRRTEKTLEHLDFLAEPGIDPRSAFVTSFLQDTEGENPILVYDASAERQTLQNLIPLFPEHAAALRQRLKRLYDLMQPFAEGWYHHPDMNGSISLKSVLPALVPELRHTDLIIQNGSHAMAVYEQMHQTTDLFAHQEQMSNLREYCRLDTLGMVRIFEVLEQTASEQ